MAYVNVTSDELKTAFANGLKLSNVPLGVSFIGNAAGTRFTYDLDHYYFLCSDESSTGNNYVLKTDKSFVVLLTTDLNTIRSTIDNTGLYDIVDAIVMAEVKKNEESTSPSDVFSIPAYITGDHSMVLGLSTASSGKQMYVNGSNTYDKDSVSSAISADNTRVTEAKYAVITGTDSSIKNASYGSYSSKNSDLVSPAGSFAYVENGLLKYVTNSFVSLYGVRMENVVTRSLMLGRNLANTEGMSNVSVSTSLVDADNIFNYSTEVSPLYGTARVNNSLFIASNVGNGSASSYTYDMAFGLTRSLMNVRNSFNNFAKQTIGIFDSLVIGDQIMPSYSRNGKSKNAVVNSSLIIHGASTVTSATTASADETANIWFSGVEDSIVIGKDSGAVYTNAYWKHSILLHNDSGEANASSPKTINDQTKYEATFNNLIYLYGKLSLGSLSLQNTYFNYEKSLIFTTATCPGVFGINTSAKSTDDWWNDNDHTMMYTDGIALCGGFNYGLLKIGCTSSDYTPSSLINPGTTTCKSSGKTLVVQPIQELDGSMRVSLEYPHTADNDSSMVLCGDGSWKSGSSFGAGLMSDWQQIYQIQTSYVYAGTVSVTVTKLNEGSSYSSPAATEVIKADAHLTEEDFGAVTEVGQEASRTITTVGSTISDISVFSGVYNECTAIESGEKTFAGDLISPKCYITPINGTLYVLDLYNGDNPWQSFEYCRFNYADIILSEPTINDIGKTFMLYIYGKLSPINQISIYGKWDIYQAGPNIDTSDKSIGQNSLRPLYLPIMKQTTTLNQYDVSLGAAAEQTKYPVVVSVSVVYGLGYDTNQNIIKVPVYHATQSLIS